MLTLLQNYIYLVSTGRIRESFSKSSLPGRLRQGRISSETEFERVTCTSVVSGKKTKYKAILGNLVINLRKHNKIFPSKQNRRAKWRKREPPRKSFLHSNPGPAASNIAFNKNVGNIHPNASIPTGQVTQAQQISTAATTMVPTYDPSWSVFSNYDFNTFPAATSLGTCGTSMTGFYNPRFDHIEIE